jgi:DNA-binding response OmpR family regulator
MDCQMPDMDGYATCKAIRNFETEHSLTPAIIIGVTADTTRTVRKKCLGSGMNDNIYKPITLETLTATIARYMPHAIDHEKITNIQNKEKVANNHRDATEKKNDSIKQLPVNLAHIRSYADGDRESEKMLFNIFIEQAKNSVAALNANLVTHNHLGWCHAAHKLKGSSANLGAEQLAELCQMAEYHDSGIADEDILRAIQAEFNKVDKFLNHLIEENKYSNNDHIH